jgi:nucleotide-binding universal stress UspA family protein
MISSSCRERRGERVEEVSVFETIAVATDGTKTADKAVDMALDIAERFGARLLIFSVYTPASVKELEKARAQVPEDLQWSIHATQNVDAILGRALERARARGLDSESVARPGEPADVICELASDHHADLLVIGNKGMDRRVFGSVPKSICQNAPCSVVVAKTT